MCTLLTNCIKPMYTEEGPLENTTVYFVLEKKKGFNYCILFGELIYVYATCCPDISYVVTTLLKFSLAPTEYHYTLLKGFAKYLQNTIEWDICLCCTKQLHCYEFQYLRWYNIPD